MSTDSTAPHHDALESFLRYSFATDEAYQQGLAGILAGGVLEGKTEEEKAELFLRSEVFYFNRLTGSSLTIDEARRARQNVSSVSVAEGTSSRSDNATTAPAQSQSNGAEQEPQMLSFAQLKALIEQGRTDEIPNNKVIPDVLSSEAPSESKAAPRRKPWEVNAST
ncbi:hypothetical protein C8Q77DRAFT_1217355 [Trametes polyzona]|nr:hypothetical protein C8Q77DRAFT_1217355 [Trametes polyzona]